MGRELAAAVAAELGKQAFRFVGPQEVDWRLQQLAKTSPALVTLALSELNLAELTVILRARVQVGEPVLDLESVLETLLLSKRYPGAELREVTP